MGGNATLKFSKGFNLSDTIQNAIADSDFFTIKNGQQTVTAAKNIGGGGTTSLNASGGNVKLFSTAADAQGTVSFKQAGTAYFATPTADSSQQITVGTQGGAGTIKVKQTTDTTNQSLSNKLSNFTSTQWLLVAGVAAGGFLLFYLGRK